MPEPNAYELRMDLLSEGREPIDIPAIVSTCEHPWFNQSLCRVNDAVVRMGIFEGEFHFHSHDEEDEFFLVLEGTIHLDIEDETVTLCQHQGCLVPKGVVHRPRSPEKSVVLMVERHTIDPVGSDE